MKLIEEVGKLQDDWDMLADSGHMTMQAIRDLCIPFRDKYKLTDTQTLKIARREATATQISEWTKNKESNNG